MERFVVAACVGGQFVKAEVRAEEAGAVVEGFVVGVQWRETPFGFFDSSLQAALGSSSLQAALGDVNGGWTGCFSVADVKTVVDAVMRGVQAHDGDF